MRATKLLWISLLGAGALGLNLTLTRAADIYKADVPDNLNLGTSWVGGVAPGAADVAVWDHTVVNNLSASPGANLSWGGIRILDPAGPITLNADGSTLTNGAAGMDLSLAAAALTINCPVALSADQTWSVTNNQTLTLASVVSGPAALKIAGGGDVILNSANTYSGGTLIAGRVHPGNATSLGTGQITFTNGYVRFDVFPSGGVMANSNLVTGTNILDLAGISAVLDGAWKGAGTLWVTNLVSGATFTLGGNGNAGGNMAGFTGAIVVTDPNSAGTLRFNNGGGNNNTGNAAMTLDLGNSSVSFFTRNRNGAVTFGALSGGPNTVIRQGASSSGTSTYTIGALNLNTTFAGTISDGGSSSAGIVALTKVGTGTLTLSGNNHYTGTTTISGGTLQIGDGTTAGTGTLGTGAVVNNATLIFNRPDDFEVDNAISGTGITVKQNVNTLTYGGNDTASGAFDIEAGTLALNAAAALSSPIFIAAGASLDVSQNPTFTLSSTLSGFGTVLGTLTVSGGAVNPGQAGAAGTLTFANGLTELGGVNHQFQLSAPGGTNDQIVVTGDLTLNGLNNIVASAFGGGNLPSGVYPLITYSGALNGSLTNLALSISGGLGVLTNPPGEIALVITPPPRGATNLTWLGDGAANAWDVNTSSNWLAGATRFTFLNGDRVTFDDTGAANSTVSLTGPVLPAAVTVNAAADYTFTGAGEINGATGLFKTNSGTLTLLTTNSYTGPTIIAGGTLAVMDLENGGLASSLGAADSNPTNLIFNGGTLSYLGPGSTTDRGATLENAGANVNVTAGSTLTLNGSWTGSGALTVSGPGTLALNAANTYSGGTVLSNGVLALGSNLANSSGLGPTNAPVIFAGGTLQLFGYSGSTANNYATCYNPLVVPAGQSGTLRMFPRGPGNSGANSGLRSSLSGAGTLNLVVNYVRDNLDGDWSAFTGTINVTSKNGSGDEMRINNSFGYSSAVIYLNDGVILDRVSTANATIDIGELGGTSGAVIGPGNSTAQNPTWRVGWRNTTNTFAGTIQDDGVTTVVKVGTGRWILSGQNTYHGATIVSNGVLALATGPSGDASIGSSTNIFIAAGATLDVTGQSTGTLPLYFGQTLSGAGTVNGILDSTGGGTVAPGDGTGLGTLTVTTNANLGGTLWIKLDRAATPNSDRLVAPTITLQGVSVVFTNVGPALQVGDTFTIFTGAVSGTVGSVTVPGGNYYTWDTSRLAIDGTVRLTGVLPPPAISHIDFSGLASGYLYINATNGAPGGAVSVLTSTNLALPLSQWSVLGTGNFDASGNLSNFYVPVDNTQPQSFYILQAN